MQYKVAILALAAAVMAGPIEDTLKTVDDDINALTAAVGSYSGDKAPLVTAGNKLITDIKAGVSTVKGADKLDIIAASGLVKFVQGLGKDGESLQKALFGKRDQVQKAGECATVRTLASDLATQSDSLIEAVKSKVPDELASTADLLAKQLRDTLKQANEDFSEANCKDSGSKPTGGSSSSAAPTGTKPTGGSSSSAAPTPSASGSSKPSATGTAPVTVPTGAAGVVAPAALFAAAVAALAL